MITEVVAKLSGEAMLSLYPMIVKLIDIPMHTQMWTRFFAYALISSMFVDWKYILEAVTTTNGLMLMFVTLAHVYTSYEGFANLESGVSYSLFYLYPLMILLMAGERVSLWMLLALLGVFILYTSNDEQKENMETTTKSQSSAYGVGMIVLAAFTEAWIYFIVRNLPTKNNWNHVFLSYVLGALGLSVYELSKTSTTPSTTLRSWNVKLALGLNAGIGLFGYLLRFYATSRLPPQIYAPLSYFGVVMAYVYGLFFKTDVFSWKKIIGTVFILVSNYMTQV